MNKKDFRNLLRASNLYISSVEMEAEIAQMKQAKEMTQNVNESIFLKDGIEQAQTVLQVINDEIDWLEEEICGDSITEH